jgi:hypothetical protein
MKRQIFYLFFLITIIFSCTTKNNKIFNGEIFIIDNKPDTDILYGEQIKLDGLYAGFMSVYDSVIVFKTDQYIRALNCIALAFNIKTGKQINSLVKAGRGPDEYAAATTTLQFFIDNNGLKMWFYDYDVKKTCILIDINSNTIVDCIDISWLKPERKEPCSRFFILNDSLFLALNMEEPAYNSEYRVLPHIWSLYNYRTGEKLRQYDAFNESVFLEEFFGFNSEDQLKPDHTKFVMPMEFFRQINIVDIQTGEIKGYMFKDSPDYSIVAKKRADEFKTYYTRACVDNDFIYATIKEKDNTVIDVFDWNGNYLKRLSLDKEMNTFITLDPVNKYLYIPVIGEDEEEIYRYDVSYLYKNKYTIQYKIHHYV